MNEFECVGTYAGGRLGDGRYFLVCAGCAAQARAGEMQGEAGTAQPEKAPPLPPRPSNSTADHSKFEALKGPFANGSGGHEGLPDLP